MLRQHKNSFKPDQTKTLEDSTMCILRACVAMALIAACATASSEGLGASASRGELLYSTYCVSCHTTEVHWREKRLAADWVSLKAQVLRWQANAGLGLGEDDVLAISRYLNDVYYHYPVADTKQTRTPSLRQDVARQGISPASASP